MLPIPQTPAYTGGANLLAGAASDLLRIVVAGRDPLARVGLATILRDFEDILVVDCDGDVALVDAGATFGKCVIPSLLLVTDLAQANEALAAGARGVISRNSTPRQIHAALRAIAEGLRVIDGEALLHAPVQHTDEAELLEPLTARELEVLNLLSAGRTNKEIASRLGITEHTIKFHVNAILGKLGAETRTEAVVHAARLGIVTL
ncbi:MAG TPA: response regulator transcription factor [Thermoanaerobaculia bacterium]|nr:response regulator transcription factor [Thermoanaerobaculia bacterium]